MLQDRQILNATINRTYGGDVRQESIGVFAQGEFYASDQLSFTLGGRYTNENKRATIYLQPTNNNSACNFAAKSCDVTGGPPPFVGRSDERRVGKEGVGTWKSGWTPDQ